MLFRSLSVGLIPENELTRSAKIEMDTRTNGAIVYENMETSIPGIFGCGNVVHVHDLVDFVTAESMRAGAAAAKYAAGQEAGGAVMTVKTGSCVTYTVPQKIRRENVEKAVEVFFRVNNVYRDMVIRVMDGENVLCQFKREHMAPGEMEKIAIPRVLLDKAQGDVITVTVEKQ